MEAACSAIQSLPERTLSVQFWAGSSDIFYFCPSSKGRGWGGGVQRWGGISLKSEEKGGKKGGGRGRCRKRVGGHFWGGGGVLNIYFEGWGATLELLQRGAEETFSVGAPGVRQDQRGSWRVHSRWWDQRVLLGLYLSPPSSGESKCQGSVNGGFQHGGSSLLGERNSATPFLPQFNLLFTSILTSF